MKDEKSAVLQEIYYDCLQSRKELNEKLQNNKNRVYELDAFLKSITENEAVDHKFFSPRDAENLYGNRIKEINSEKKDIEKENIEYYHKLNQLDRQIEQLERFIKEQPEDEKESENAEVSAAEPDPHKHLKVLDIQEKERQRIARELHDSSVQNMTHLVHMIELSSMFIDQDPVRAKLELASCTKNLREIISEIRDTIFNLRPMSFDDLGFKQSIDDLVSNAKIHYTDCNIIYDVTDIKITQYMDKEAENLILVTIYRIVQEALINALKHAQAKQIILNIKVQDTDLLMEITDDGKGFDLDKMYEQKDKHFGIAVMKERVDLLHGTINIETSPGNGTKIRIIIPQERSKV